MASDIITRKLLANVSGRLSQFPATTWYIDPTSGNDTTGTGAFAAPYKTCQKLIDTGSLKAGDEIVIVGNGPIVENKADGTALTFPAGITLRPHRGRGAFQAYNAVSSGSWSVVGFDATSGNTYSNTYKASITNLFGGVGTKTNANKTYPSIMYNGSPLKEIKLGTTTTAGYMYTTRTAVLNYVDITPGTFFTESANGSTYESGYQQGSFTYYVNTGVGAPGSLAAVAQRLKPIFGYGCTVRDFDFFGGVDHNGVELQQGLGERLNIIYPAAHGVFCAGSTMIDCVVESVSPIAATSYAFHGFNSPATYVARTYLKRCGVRNATSAYSIAFGSHGIDANPIMGSFDLDDCWAENVHSLFGFDKVANNPTIRNFRGRNIGRLGSGQGMEILDPDIVYSTATSIATGWNNPSSGNTVNVWRGKSSSLNQNWWAAASTGTLNFYDHIAVAGCDDGNQFWANSTAAGTVTFTRCAITTVAADGRVNAVWAGTTTASTFTDCALSGLTPASNATLVNTVKGGDLGIELDIDGGVIIHPESCVFNLGRVTKGLTGAISGTGVQNPWVVDTKGGHILIAGGSTISVEFPTTFKATCAGMSGTGQVIAGGDNGALYKRSYLATTSSTAWTSVSTGLTKNFTAIISGGSTDALVWLLCDDGSIYEYNASTDAITARTSGVSYPLIGGFRNGTTLIAWGNTSDGQTDGTVGGVIASSDTGATWANSLITSDSSPAGIGGFALRIKCGGFAQGTYFLAGTRGTFLTSATGLTGSWTARTRTGDLQFTRCAVNTTTNEILIASTSSIFGSYAKKHRLWKIDVGNYGATFIASQSTTTVTVAQLISGKIGPGTLYIGGTNSGTLTLNGTGTGGTGTYTCSTSATNASSLMTVTAAALHPSQWTLVEVQHPLSSIAGISFVPSTFYNPAQGPSMGIVDNLSRGAYSENGTNWIVTRTRVNIANRDVFPVTNDGRKKYLVSTIV